MAERAVLILYEVSFLLLTKLECKSKIQGDIYRDKYQIITTMFFIRATYQSNIAVPYADELLQQ